MTDTRKPDLSPGSDPLTVVVAAVLALTALAGTLFCLIYALWWLLRFWAPT